jgi:hypothetical protein
MDFETLGVFYLGRLYDSSRKAPGEGLLLYAAKDLVTHAVCVGMTGSGKTGLCICLLEEAALDGIPAIIIDPKGDLGTLLLTFPALRPEDFAPWINVDDGTKQGVSPEAYAQQQAELWRTGLAGWGQDGRRIQRLRDAVDVRVYTPGSTAGIPISIMRSFARPSAAFQGDAELLREHIGSAVTSLLGLLGIEADPVKSREHILLSTILDTAWRRGQDLDLAGLIRAVQSPAVGKIGVFDLESFYPARDRFQLGMALNALLAAPGFQAWLEGDPLDVQRCLYTAEGKPRLAIFSIAHLNEAERMFFVSLLLNQVLVWMRQLPGTTSLRALVYMDEIFGYFPPVANPPSKQPLLTLLKQARAFGVGVVLATQNPVDLDYKGLSNAGTWLIGRLQMERDMARVLDGLEGAATAAGGGFDRGRMEATIAGLGHRIFLLNNVHEDAPVVFETRWAMSYLRGPLTRTQIKTLMDPVKAARGPAPSAAETSAPAAQAAGPATAPPVRTPPAPGAAARPVLAADIPQHFVPVRGRQPDGAALVYEPMVLGVARVRFTESKAGVESTQDVTVLARITGEAIPVNWDEATPAGVAASDLESSPAEGAGFAELPAAAITAKSHEDWRKDFAGWLHRTQAITLYRSPALGALSQPGESERDFRIRLQQAGREQRDAATEALRQKYAPKIASIQERIRRAEQSLARESQQVTQQGIQTAISVGATLLGAFLGRKAVSTSTLGRATTAMRGAGRVLREREDVGRAQENLAALQQQLAELEAQFEAEVAASAAAADPLAEKLDTVTIRPTKADIAVRLVALAWTPWWIGGSGEPVPAWK